MTTPVRPSWAVSDADGEIQTTDARFALGAAFWPQDTTLRKRPGLIPGTGGAIVSASGTPNNNVTVSPFQLVLNPTRSIAPYLVTSATPVVFNAFATPPSASANRRDLIILQQNDMALGDPTSPANLRYIVGSAPASDPVISGSTDYVIIAQVVVRQNATSVLQSDITPRLPAGYATVAVGGVLPINSVSDRNAIANPYPGMTIDRTDKGWQERYDGGAWRPLGPPIVANVAALADITAPLTGQLAAVLAAPFSLYRFNGTAWIRMQEASVWAEQSRGADALSSPVVMESVTGNVVAGRRYKITWCINTASNVLGPPNTSMFIRTAAGASINTGSTIVREFGIKIDNAVFTPTTVVTVFTASVSEQRTFGTTGTTNGAPVLTIEGGSTKRLFLVEELGT